MRLADYSSVTSRDARTARPLTVLSNHVTAPVAPLSSVLYTTSARTLSNSLLRGVSKLCDINLQQRITISYSFVLRVTVIKYYSKNNCKNYSKNNHLKHKQPRITNRVPEFWALESRSGHDQRVAGSVLTFSPTAQWQPLTLMCLSPSSMIWYWPKGNDALRLERYPQ